MSMLFLLSNTTFNSRLTCKNHSASFVHDDDEKNDNEKKNENDNNYDDDDDEKNNNNENNKNNENDNVENNETQIIRRKKFEKILEQNKNTFEKKTLNVLFDFKSFRDQDDVDVKSKKSEKNVDEKRTSLSSSFNSFSEFFNFDEKKIVSFITSQRCVVFKSTFDSKSSFNLRRNSRRLL